MATWEGEVMVYQSYWTSPERSRRERLLKILTGKIPNRLTLAEIHKGLYEIYGTWCSSSMIEEIATYATTNNRSYEWLNVLLFLPLKEIPTLINKKDSFVVTAAKYRLQVGK